MSILGYWNSATFSCIIPGTRQARKKWFSPFMPLYRVCQKMVLRYGQTGLNSLLGVDRNTSSSLLMYKKMDKSWIIFGCIGPVIGLVLDGPNASRYSIPLF